MANADNPHRNLAPDARALLVRELGEEWLRTHNFIAQEMTLADVQRLLPWLKENYQREKAGELVNA